MLSRMNRSRCARLLARCSAVLAPVMALMITSAANAQAAAPQPTLSKSPQPWVGLAFMFIMLVLVIGVSLMPSKRTHLD